MSTKTKKQSDSSKLATIELPGKIGFGRNFWEVIDTIDSDTVIYAKQGRGDEEMLMTVDQLKNTDPQLKIEATETRTVLKFSESFDFKFIVLSRKPMEMIERDKRRVRDVIGAIVDGFNTGDEYNDKDFDQKVSEFPRVVKYYTDNNEEHWVSDNKELWIREDLFKGFYDLLKTVIVAYTELSNGEKYDPLKYLERLETVLPYII
ncbi:hypothetical protein GOV04_05090 [Candidatus Woesearchaeota archaeon]|nr:hypothetical protein [Candidatus Woesearchaeota archaeon]